MTDDRVEHLEQELRHLRAELHRAHEEIARPTELLAGRDQEIRELRARVTPQVRQVSIGGAEAQGVTGPAPA